MRKRKEFRHLNAKDRDRLHALYLYGHSQKAIAEVLGVHPGTVSRELSRYRKTTWRYSSARAQQDADEKRARSKRPGMKIAENPKLKRYVITQLERLRSPDEIAGRMKKEGRALCVGKNAIYKWLYSEDGKPYCRYLCTRRTRQRGRRYLSKRALIPDRIPLKNRPVARGLIHAEGDLFVSPTRLRVKDCGLVVVTADTKLISGTIIPNKTSAVVVRAMREITNTLRPDTYTLDNGIENVHHKEFGVDTYFCDPGSPWQKPHVESSIGLIRRWFLPKGTNLSEILESVFQSHIHLLNSKYRKSLGYQSSYEASLKRGIIKRVPRVSLKAAIAFR